MDVFKDEIGNNVYQLEESLKKYTIEHDAIARKADGRLIRCKNNGKPCYYQVIRGEGGYTKRNSVEKEPDMISALARKEYLERLIKVITNNIAVLKSTDGLLQAENFDALKAGMRKAYRELPDECFFPAGAGSGAIMNASKSSAADGIRRHLEWANEPYDQSSYMPEARKHMTSAGFRVRSKSEQAIAEQLIHYGVPFRYEQIIMIRGYDYSADFTFRDKNMELFYWEHAGMMNVPSYVEKYYNKMNAYNSIGIMPWKNLIVTYDTDGVINIPMVKAIIENEVIPRL